MKTAPESCKPLKETKKRELETNFRIQRNSLEKKEQTTVLATLKRDLVGQLRKVWPWQLASGGVVHWPQGRG